MVLSGHEIFDIQIKLLDVLLRAGASPDVANDALVNGNFEAAEHLICRGGKLTLAPALCLGYWDKVPDLAEKATEKQKQFSLILAALNGQSEAIRRLIPLGLDLNMPSKDFIPMAPLSTMPRPRVLWNLSNCLLMQVQIWTPKTVSMEELHKTWLSLQIMQR